MPTLLLSTLVLFAPAPAEAPANTGDADERARVSATHYEFENDNVDGEVLSPTGEPVRGAAGIRHGSMITIRGTFTDHLNALARDV